MSQALIMRHSLRDINVVVNVTVRVQKVWCQTEDIFMQQLGQILFILGIIFAFVAGIGLEHPWLPVGLALFGIFVGLVNILDVDTNKFLITVLRWKLALQPSSSFPSLEQQCPMS